jgi:hypothetical protein
MVNSKSCISLIICINLMGCQLLDGGKKAAKIPFQGVLKTGEIAGKTVYKTGEISGKTVYKTSEIAGKSVYYTGKYTANGAYKVGKFTGNRVLDTGKGLYYIGSIPVKITNEALNTSVKVLTVTTKTVGLGGKVITTTRKIQANELEAELMAIRGAGNVLNVLVKAAI